jgi:hypothetical protein
MSVRFHPKHASEVHEQESGENAAQLLEQTLIREKCLYSGVVPLVQAGDNGQTCIKNTF